MGGSSPTASTSAEGTSTLLGSLRDGDWRDRRDKNDSTDGSGGAGGGFLTLEEEEYAWRCLLGGGEGSHR